MGGWRHRVHWPEIAKRAQAGRCGATGATWCGGGKVGEVVEARDSLRLRRRLDLGTEKAVGQRRGTEREGTGQDRGERGDGSRRKRCGPGFFVGFVRARGSGFWSRDLGRAPAYM